MNNNPTKKQRLYLLIPIIQILLVEIAIGFSDWFEVDLDVKDIEIKSLTDNLKE